MSVAMRNIVGLVIAAVVLIPTGAIPEQPAADRSWAFPMKPERVFPEDTAVRSLPGSTKTYTQAQIDDLLNPPDWYPEQHPAPPPIVVSGHGAALACGACHLMSGLGHPESSDLTGLTADYIVQQMADFKSGARKEPTRMNAIAKEVTDEEGRQAAEWFARLPRRSFTLVVEAETVPKTFLGSGRMRFFAARETLGRGSIKRCGCGETQNAISLGANASRMSNTRTPALLYVAKIISSL